MMMTRASDVDVIRWRRRIKKEMLILCRGMHVDFFRGKPFVCSIKWLYNLLYSFFEQKYLFVLSVQRVKEKNVSLVYLHRQQILSMKKALSSHNLTLYFSACTTYHFNVRNGKFTRALVNSIQTVHFVHLSFACKCKIPAPHHSAITHKQQYLFS